jgi:hypothetical protein
MKTWKVLLLFCEQNGRGLLTEEEKQRLAEFNSEYDRINKHSEQFAIGVAKRKLDAARDAYSKDPSEANRGALDRVRATWLPEDSENCAQRQIVKRALRDKCAEFLRPLLPPIMLRAANALAWIAAQVQFEEKQKHAFFEAPYTPSVIIKNLEFFIGQIRMSADMLRKPAWEHNGKADHLSGCEWIPHLLEVNGPVWEGTLDPQSKTASDPWRNIGQVGNPLFWPVLCEFGERSLHDAGAKPVNRFRDNIIPPPPPAPQPVRGPRRGAVAAGP